MEEEEQNLGLPLLQPQENDEETNKKPKKSPSEKAVRKAFKGTAHLANLLPTGTVLAFQILSPVLSREGRCASAVSQSMTVALLAGCAASCFVLCFTDSFRDERGKVRYALATFRGLLVLDLSASATLSPDEAAKRRITVLDFFHAFNSVLVFAATALLDKNVVNCLYPSPSPETEELLAILPVCVGFVCSILFIAFPSKRHGIGFPLSRS
ncbi:unnamed protein product [Cuscuta campestris]|uniref:DUF679 domain-containing protein n=1 Tax=Cuscuta campestris TaxID=132261 RepID=A0A484KAC6_9ASTE|nr:unnamed protein product [Cuscuta campestris]